MMKLGSLKEERVKQKVEGEQSQLTPQPTWKERHWSDRWGYRVRTWAGEPVGKGPGGMDGEKTLTKVGGTRSVKGALYRGRRPKQLLIC